MSSEPPIVATQTRRLSSARSGASPPPTPSKCLKKASEAVGAELQEGGLKGEVFNEEDNGDAETLPLPGLSDPKADIATLNDETAECFSFDADNLGIAAPKTPQALAPTTPWAWLCLPCRPSRLYCWPLFRHRCVSSTPRCQRVYVESRRNSWLK